MSRNGFSIFLVVTISFLIVPIVLPYLLGSIVLPIWAYLIYAVIVLVNAGFFLINSSILIDRILLSGKISRYVLTNFALLVAGLGIEYLCQLWFESFIEVKGVKVSDYISFETRIGQITTVALLGILSIAASLAYTFSDKWKLAKFRYNEALRNNSLLEDTVTDLENQVNSLKEENKTIRQNSDKTQIISVKVDMMMRNIKVDDICYIECEGDYIQIHTSDGNSYMTLMRMKTMESLLPFDSFCRVHRSYIVNVDKVEALKDRKLFVSGKQIPLADSCKAAFFEVLSHKTVSLKSL